jgi:hypothetical protein
MPARTRAATSLDIVQHRLVSQRLAGAKLETPSAVVQWLGAVQAQDYAGAKWGVAQRATGATNTDVEQAFASGDILRTHVLRPTWHFVTPADIRWLLALTAPRVQAINASMYRKVGLTPALLTRSIGALTGALEGGCSLRRDELRSMLRAARIPVDGEERLSYVLMNAELEGIVCSGPRRGKQFTYALLDERVPSTKALSRDEALASLSHRFFTSRGPATVHDFAKWSGLTVADARDGLEAVKADLVHGIVDGKTYWFAAGRGRTRARPAPTVHLLSIYDEYISGYKDRSAIVSTRDAARLWKIGNALSYIVVINGRIRGTWKRRLDKSIVVIRTEVFDRLTRSEAQAVEDAVERYGAFLRMTAALE